MIFKVIKRFEDLQDERHVYNEGDVYPREGLKTTKKRCAELAGSKNKRGIPLIEEVEESDTPAEGNGEGDIPADNAEDGNA